MYEHKNLAILIRALLDKLDSRSNFWTRKRMSDLHSPIDINLERDEMEMILDYLNEFSLIEEVKVNDKNYVLVHAGLLRNDLRLDLLRVEE